MMVITYDSDDGQFTDLEYENTRTPIYKKCATNGIELN